MYPLRGAQMSRYDLEKVIKDTIEFARGQYSEEYVPLHRPVFEGRETDYLLECLESNFVSSVGKRVGEFEQNFAAYTGARFAVAVVNGTSALHLSLMVSGVSEGDHVITQPLTFVATCNAIRYCGALPVFVDVDIDTMGLSPSSLSDFLSRHAKRTEHGAYLKYTGRKISACLPMHTFGVPCRIREIAEICAYWRISLIEDAAEALGSFVDGKHVGNFGESAAFSFNGNKLITTGGGGMLVTGDEEIATRAKHISTTAKIPHPYEFVHDEVGFNYRMPNLNAALGCAQLEEIERMLALKRELAEGWRVLYGEANVPFHRALSGDTHNHWLSAIALDSVKDRDNFLKITNAAGVMTRPIWRLMSELQISEACRAGDLTNSLELQDSIVNSPSSVPFGAIKKMKASTI